MSSKVIQRVIELKDKFTPGFQKLNKGTLAFKRDVRDLKRAGSQTFKSIAKGVAVAGAAAVAAGVGFGALVNKTADAGDRIDKMSQQLGMSRQGFQQLDYVLDQNGMSIDRMGTGMRTLAQQMDGVNQGAQGSIDLFNRLGLDSSTAAKSQEEAFKDVVSAFQQMEEGAEKTALAQKVFGTNGRELLPMLNQQEGSIDGLIDKYDKLGSAMSDKAIDNSVKFKDTLSDLRTGIGGMFRSLSSPALPAFTNGVQWLVDKIPKLREFGVNAFESMQQAIENNREKFEAIKSTFLDIKNGISDAFGADGEGGGALNWFVESAIPAVIGGIASVLDWTSRTYYFFRDNWTLIGPLVYGIAGAMTAYYVITKAVTISKYALTAAQWAWNAAMTANPIGLVVMGIGLLIAAGVLLIKNWDNVKLAGMKLWNGIVGAVEWGVNSFVSGINKIIDFAVGGINGLINALNKIPGVDISDVSVSGFDNADFGAAKFDTSGKEFDFSSGGKSASASQEPSFEDTLKGFEKQKSMEIKSQQTSNDDLTSALNGNTETLKATKGGGNTFNITVNASDLTAEEIADKLVPRIERDLLGT